MGMKDLIREPFFLIVVLFVIVAVIMLILPDKEKKREEKILRYLEEKIEKGEELSKEEIEALRIIERRRGYRKGRKSGFFDGFFMGDD